MQLSRVKMRELFEVSAHMGHKTNNWNPLMSQYIYGTYNTIHIIDLQKTVPLFQRAIEVVKETVKNKGRLLFVSTKPITSQTIMEAATRCGQYYINSRWIGGLLTNWKFIHQSANRLKKDEAILLDQNIQMIKKEKTQLQKKCNKINKYLGGIKNMAYIPDLLFVIDANRENLAIKEANKMGIPVIAILDTNADPRGVDYPIPANDDSSRANHLYCKLIAEAAITGIKAEQQLQIKSTKENTDVVVKNKSMEKNGSSHKQNKQQTTQPKELDQKLKPEKQNRDINTTSEDLTNDPKL